MRPIPRRLKLPGTAMLGAIAGDIVGSRFEGWERVPSRFKLFDEGCAFTDDTVCIIAVADALLSGRGYADALRSHALRHPDRGYGEMFYEWAMDLRGRAYGSWGNGAPMRSIAVGWLLNSEAKVLTAATRQARVTHNTDEAIEASKAVALAIFLLRTGVSTESVIDRLSGDFPYKLRPPPYEASGFDVSAAGTTEQALSAALFSKSWSDAVRRVIRLGGDADTLAAIAGGVAEARFGLPRRLRSAVVRYLPGDLLKVVDAFELARLS